MATNRKFNVRSGLSAGTGSTLKDVVDNTGKVLDVGLLADLKTVEKANTVGAINEIYDNFTAGADFTGGTVRLSGGAILANSQTISGGGTTTIPAGYNANSFGPVVTIANGTEVVVSSTSFWVIRD